VIPFNAAAVVELPDANLTDVMVNGLTLAEIAEDVQQTGSTVTFSLAAGRYEICYQPTQIYLIHYSTERSLAQLLAVPKAKAVLVRYIPDYVAQGNRGMMRFLGQSPLREMARHPLVAISGAVLDQIDRELAEI